MLMGLTSDGLQLLRYVSGPVIGAHEYGNSGALICIHERLEGAVFVGPSSARLIVDPGRASLAFCCALAGKTPAKMRRQNTQTVYVPRPVTTPKTIRSALAGEPRGGFLIFPHRTWGG